VQWKKNHGYDFVIDESISNDAFGPIITGTVQCDYPCDLNVSSSDVSVVNANWAVDTVLYYGTWQFTNVSHAFEYAWITRGRFGSNLTEPGNYLELPVLATGFWGARLYRDQLLANQTNLTLTGGVLGGYDLPVIDARCYPRYVIYSLIPALGPDGHVVGADNFTSQEVGYYLEFPQMNDMWSTSPQTSPVYHVNFTDNLCTSSLSTDMI
jgi:hypothetical protein